MSFDFAHGLGYSSQPSTSLGTSTPPDQYSLNETQPWTRHRLRLSIVCPAVSVFLDPALRVALQAFQPFPSISRIESRGFVVRKMLTAGLSFLSAQHIFRQLPGRPCHRQIQPGGSEYKSQLVGHAES